MLLVLGYGNTLRNDDGAGPEVVATLARLQLPGVETLSCDLLTPELADPLSRADAVVFVDAAVDAPREVLLRPLEPAASSQVLAHAADPRTLLALARDVFGHAPKAWLLSIPVADMAIGEHFSDVARHGIACAVQRIVRLQESWT
jgi:hydrogenase maturation protease